MRKAKNGSGAARGARIGGAFRLVDSINDYARQRNSVLARLPG